MRQDPRLSHARPVIRMICFGLLGVSVLLVLATASGAMQPIL